MQLTEPTQTTQDPSSRWAFALLAIAFAIRLGAGAGQDLWDDEVASLVVAQTPLASLGHYFRTDPHPPLFFVLLKFWIFFEQSDFWLRLLPALIGTINVFVVYRFLTSAANSRVGLWGAALLAFAPFHVWASTELRSHVLVSLFVTAGLFGLWRHLNAANGRRWLVGATLAMLAAAWAHYFGIVAFGAFWIATVALSKNRLRDASLSAAIFVVGYLPWMPFLYEQAQHAQSFRSIEPVSSVLSQIVLMTGFSVFPWTLAGMGARGVFQIAGLFLLALGVFALWRPVLRGRNRQPDILIRLFIGLAIGLVLVGSRFVPGYQIRYMAFLVAPLVMLAALSYGSIAGSKSRYALVFLLGLFATISAGAFFDDSLKRPDYSGFVDRIERAGGTCLIYHSSSAPALLRAASNSNVEVIALRSEYGQPIGNVELKIAGIDPKDGPIYLYAANQALYDPDQRILTALAERFESAGCQTFASAMTIETCRFQKKEFTVIPIDGVN